MSTKISTCLYRSDLNYPIGTFLVNNIGQVTHTTFIVLWCKPNDGGFLFCIEIQYLGYELSTGMVKYSTELLKVLHTKVIQCWANVKAHA